MFANPDFTAAQSAEWAVNHLSERQSVFTHNDLLAAVLARDPGAVTVDAAEKAIAELANNGTLHRAGMGLPRENHAPVDRHDTVAPRPAQRGAEGSGQANPVF